MIEVKGLDFPIRFSPNGNLQTCKLNDKLVANLKSIVTTTVGQRVMRPTYGVPADDLLFTKMQAVSTIEIEADIREAISLYEPRVTLIDVQVVEKLSDSAFTISIVFKSSSYGYQAENSFTFDI